MAEELSLLISTDKEEYKLGDTVNITYLFLNNSNHSITLLPWGGAYTTSWISIYNAYGEKMDNVKLIIFEIKFIPEKDDFITLESGKTVSYKFIGKITNGDLEYLGSQLPYKGIFIDFENSAYLLDTIGDYKIKATYKTEEEWLRFAKDLSINNFWTGSIESKEIEIKIVAK